jgi:C4-dicarboxylate transporter DctM subunit
MNMSNADILKSEVLQPDLFKRNYFSIGSALYNRFAEYICMIFMGLMVVVVGTQIFFRYILNSPLVWSAELAGYLFAWVTFLGATISASRSDSPAIQMFVEKLPPSLKSSIKNLADMLAVTFSVILVWRGIIHSINVKDQITSGLGISMSIPTLILPLAGLGFLLHNVNSIIRRLSHKQKSWRYLLISVVIVGGLVAVTQILPTELSGWVLLFFIILGFLIGLPIAIVLSVAAIFALMTYKNIPLDIIPQSMFGATNNFILMAIPFFLLTGAIMQMGGLAQRLIDFATSLVGHFRGGLAIVDVVSSAFFADISGSCVADTAAIGSVMIPGMVKRGYDAKFATALQAAAGTMGMLFPPSITILLYGYIANVSIGEMFIASFLPALMVMCSFIVVAYVMSVRRNYPREQKYQGKEIWVAFKRSSFALLAPILILGGVLSGIVTPTESGVIAVVYTIFVSLVIHRETSVRKLSKSLIEAAIGTSRVTFILAGAILLGWVLTNLQIPQEIASSMLSVSNNPIILLLILNVFLVLVHAVLETSSTVFLIVPIILPIFLQLGVDPIPLGIIIVMNSALGVLTPPIGMLLYVSAGISKVKFEDLSKAVIPFCLTIVFDILLIIFFPQIVTFIPHLLR